MHRSMESACVRPLASSASMHAHVVMGRLGDGWRSASHASCFVPRLARCADSVLSGGSLSAHALRSSGMAGAIRSGRCKRPDFTSSPPICAALAKPTPRPMSQTMQSCASSAQLSRDSQPHSVLAPWCPIWPLCLTTSTSLALSLLGTTGAERSCGAWHCFILCALSRLPAFARPLRRARQRFSRSRTLFSACRRLRTNFSSFPTVPRSS